MPLTINRTILAGNLTRDPESRIANLATFSIAVNRKFKDKEGIAKEEASFFDIEAWGKTAESCMQYLVKGSSVVVEGRLRQDTWEDKETGKARSKVKIVADAVHFNGQPAVKDGSAKAPDASNEDPLFA